MRLQDKAVAITGSGSGLGREGALLFAGEGAKVVVSDLVPGEGQKVAKEVEAAGALCPYQGMSINFALPPESDVLGKSNEEMQPWDPDARAMSLRLARPPQLRDNANLALFLASDESAYMSGVTIQATDGGSGAPVAITFPTDLDQSDDITSGSIPDDLRSQIKR